MKLYIHFGIYKTGSSFLQYLCLKNKDNLLQKGIFFPESPHDKKMLAGEISPGNGYEFSQFLKFRQVTKLDALLKKWISAAKDTNCEAILITAEDLVHQLAQLDCLQILDKCLRDNNIDQTKALGYIRDLSGHALSTFKHRAKTGKIPDFVDWMAHTYETPRVLKNFYTNHKKCSIAWSLRKFKKDSGFMVDSFFSDWLNVSIDRDFEKPSVNASIELSEIILMQNVYQLYPKVADFFLRDLKALPKNQRPHSEELEHMYRKKAKTLLSAQNAVIDKMNTVLPPEEKLDTYQESKPHINVQDSIAYLSPGQLSAVAIRMGKFRKPWGKYVLFKRYIARLLPHKIRKGLLNK